jgi:hypothetical protein
MTPAASIMPRAIDFIALSFVLSSQFDFADNPPRR